MIITVFRARPRPENADAYFKLAGELGHGEGGMLGRYVGAKVFPPEMKSKVVKLSELE